MSSEPGSSTTSIHDTLQELYPQLLNFARGIMRNTNLDPEDILNDVIIQYIDHVTRNGPTERPKAYLKTMISNRRNRLLQRRKREQTASLESALGEDEDASGDRQDVVKYLLTQHRRQERTHSREDHVNALRELLDKIRWHPASSRAKVHFWAVFLLSLRVAPTERGLRGSGTFTPDVLDDLSAMIERVMPWHDDEQSLRLSVGFDVLVACWEACKAHARETASMSFGAIVEAINAHHDREALSIDQWNQWRSRTRQAIRQRCAEEGVDYEADLADIFNL